MKKLLTVLLFSFIVVFGMNTQTKAEDIIELYPYNNIKCLEAVDGCTGTKVGDANWDMAYAGYNYNFAGGQARYVADFDDANSDGKFDATEIPGNNWSSFGGMIVNDSAQAITIDTATDRTDLTGAVQRIYTYFDETGK